MLRIQPYQCGLKWERNMLIAQSRGSRSMRRHTAPGRMQATAGSHIHALKVLSSVQLQPSRLSRARGAV